MVDFPQLDATTAQKIKMLSAGYILKIVAIA